MTLPQAFREIERLRSKIHELETELEARQERIEACKCQTAPSSQADGKPAWPSSADAIQSPRPQQIWEGIYIRTTRSASRTWYGASSLFYFIGHMSSFLSLTDAQAHSPGQLLDSNSATTLLDNSWTTTIDTAEYQWPHRADRASQQIDMEKCTLNSMQEEYFLDLYWHSYHTALFPIINEAEFKEYYRSLWSSCGSVRKPSALVDITLALCMQHGISRLPAAKQRSNSDNNSADATVAGRWYYLRCQRLLAYELESPTISTLQCQLLCAVYLCCGTFQNMADGACSAAVRTAYALGIHQEPPTDIPKCEREMRKRLWWALFIFDSKFGMKLGRPFLVHQSNVSPGLPNHDLQAADCSGSNFASLGDNFTWLSYHVEMSKLLLTARAVYSAVFCESADASNSLALRDPSALESHARSTKPFMKMLEEWAEAVPSALLLRRKGLGRPLSTDVCELDVEEFAPLWLQRQRVTLELMFHNLCTNLYRPFISFGLAQTTCLLRENARQCAMHAIALAKITRQMLSSTTILAGWHEAFQWQWNAAMTLVGFLLAYPQDIFAEDVREGIAVSIDVFDIFGKSFAVALSAANIIRQLSDTISHLIRTNANEHSVGHTDMEGRKGEGAVGPVDPAAPAPSLPAAAGEHHFFLDDTTAAQLQDAFGMAFDVDQWIDLNGLWPVGYDGA